MLIEIVLCKKLNHRTIELHHTTRGETVGVLQRNGACRYFPWLGFINADDAKALQLKQKARPVKLNICKVGKTGGSGEISTRWRDLKADEFVQGCLVQAGVYAVVTDSVRVIRN